jgi:hypothetical protein
MVIGATSPRSQAITRDPSRVGSHGSFSMRGHFSARPSGAPVATISPQPFHANLFTDVQWAAIRALAVRPHRIRLGRPPAGFKV